MSRLRRDDLAAFEESPMTDLPARLRQAFWTATQTIAEDNSIHPMDLPYFDEAMAMVDTAGNGMPDEFWHHMAEAFEQCG